MFKNSRSLSPILGVLLLSLVSIIFAVVFLKLSSVYSVATPPNVVLSVSATYYRNTEEGKIILTHKGGDPIDLRDLAITIESIGRNEKLNIRFGSGFTDLRGYYYRLNTFATNPRSHDPKDVVFSNLVFTKDENGINYKWGLGGPRNDLKDYFGVVWIGRLSVSESGVYTFYLTSDDGSWLWIDGKLIIDNGGLHADRTVSKSLFLSAGVHTVKVKMFEWSGYATCILEWSGKNVSRQPIPRVVNIPKYVLSVEDSVSFDVRIPLSQIIHVTVVHVPSNTILLDKNIKVNLMNKAILRGIKAYYYTDERWNKLAKVRVENRIWYADSASHWSSDIPNWPGPIIGKTDEFSVRWVGYLYVPEDGDYTFYLTSDDGSWLWIDGNLVVDNGGLHAPREKSATVHLKKGYHPIEVRFFENHGGAVVRLEWERKVERTPEKKFLNATWEAYYYSDESWSNLVNVTTHSRIRFADFASHWPSDIPNWPKPIVGKTDEFSVNFSAKIYLHEGDYTFYLTSDDGSWLYIDGRLVIDNGGLHAPRERSGSVHLSEGYHRFDVRMFEHHGGAVIYLQYAKGAFGRQPVTSFYHSR